MTEKSSSSMSSTLSIAVLSDLHIYSKGDHNRAKRPRPSYMCADAAHASTQGNPLVDLIDLIHRDSIKSEILLCPGDIGDIASATGIVKGWEDINKVASKLSATQVVGTPGNHDYDHSHHEAEGILKTLTPGYPVVDKHARNEFWTDHFTIIDSEDCRILCLNSSAHHEGNDNERNHGRIDSRTIQDIKRELKNRAPKPIQILLCHHHPHSHADYELGEHDVMKYGQHLIDVLASNGQWLIIHGHKHHPKLTHAAGGSDAPWVFAAGSFSVFPNVETEGHSANQFYIIEFDIESFESLGWGGRIRAWDWVTEDGWLPATARSGLPAIVNFGYLGSIVTLARKIKATLPLKKDGYMNWLDLLDLHQELTRVCPADLRALERCNLNILYSDDGTPYQIARSE